MTATAVRHTGSAARTHMRAVEPATADTPTTLLGHFAVVNVWTEINSYAEGHFLERFAPGAFRATIADDRARMRCLFQHGADPSIGDKPLGQILTLREDNVGAYYEVALLETSYARDIATGTKAGVYGASFRFRALAEDWEHNPRPAPHNPQGLPERTVRVAQVIEFGPVTFPAYLDATAGARQRAA